MSQKEQFCTAPATLHCPAASLIHTNIGAVGNLSTLISICHAVKLQRDRPTIVAIAGTHWPLILLMMFCLCIGQHCPPALPSQTHSLSLLRRLKKKYRISTVSLTTHKWWGNTLYSESSLINCSAYFVLLAYFLHYYLPIYPDIYVCILV